MKVSMCKWCKSPITINVEVTNDTIHTMRKRCQCSFHRISFPAFKFYPLEERDGRDGRVSGQDGQPCVK